MKKEIRIGHQWLQPGIPLGCERCVLRDVNAAFFGMRTQHF